MRRPRHSLQSSPMMVSFSVPILICVLQLFVLSLIADAAISREVGQREFDYFALSLQWPATYCRRTHKCCTKNACCRGSNAPTEFTIHGLWPDYNDGTWPSCCQRSKFDEKEISTLHDGLEKYWPSLSCGRTSTCYSGKGSFWAHEWEKHGTCSFPVFRDEYNYFLATINLYFKYNITTVLNEAGYIPSDSEKYPLGGIISAIENSFHATPEVRCSKDAIQEIQICFYKDFQPRDCIAKGSCPKYVSLPTFASLGLLGEVTGAPLSTSLIKQS